MEFISSSTEYVPQMPGFIGVYKHIEKAMRNCYRSEAAITEDSYKKMIELAKHFHHYSVLEHGTIYLTFPDNIDNAAPLTFYKKNPFSRVVRENGYIYVTTNLRVIIENERIDDLANLVDPKEQHLKRYTFKVVCSEAIAREWNRHRGFSISQQSTRYCNYSKGKYGSQLTFLIPQWMYTLRDEYNLTDSDDFIQDLYDTDRRVEVYMDSLHFAENTYLTMTKNFSFRAQEARGVLPLDTATCVYYTGFLSDWEHFISLRNTDEAHPDIRVLAQQIETTLKEIDAWNN